MKLWRRWRGRTLLFLAVVGPGIITANVDNDAGGILTYSQAGAQYGFLLLWTMIPDHPGADRGAGNVRPHGRGNRQGPERPDPRRVRPPHHISDDAWNSDHRISATWSRNLSASPPVWSYSAFRATSPSRFARVIVWLIVVKGQYKSVEKVFLAASFFYITYIFAGVLAHPAWKDATVATFKPPQLGYVPRAGLPVHGDWRGRAPRSRPGCSSICRRP